MAVGGQSGERLAASLGGDVLRRRPVTSNARPVSLTTDKPSSITSQCEPPRCNEWRQTFRWITV